MFCVSLSNKHGLTIYSRSKSVKSLHSAEYCRTDSGQEPATATKDLPSAQSSR